MSLYNMIHGFDPCAALVLAALDLQADQIGRFRDAYLDGQHMVVLTRTGGGNREHYQAENARLVLHPLYVSDSDDEFDSTFALFRFRYPDNVLGIALAERARNIPPAKSLREKTMEAVAKLEAGDPEMVEKTKPIEKLFEEINEQMNKENKE